MAFHDQNFHVRIFGHRRAQSSRSARESLNGIAPLPLLERGLIIRKNAIRQVDLVTKIVPDVIIKSRRVRRQDRRARGIKEWTVFRIRTSEAAVQPSDYELLIAEQFMSENR